MLIARASCRILAAHPTRNCERREDTICGIAGIYHPDARAPVDEEALAAMTHVQAHRGPDGYGLWVGPEHRGVGLGHRRLAIRDLSPAGKQPISDEKEEVWVTYNGELYNEAELRRELELDHGARFRSTTDSEVLPWAWRAWGPKLVDHLEGMYAFALYDQATHELLLARDPIGIKPLFLWERDDGTLLFASELKGVLAGVAHAPPLSPDALHSFLAQGYPAPDETLLVGPAQLAPGTTLLARGEERRKRRFWAPTRAATRAELDPALGVLAEIFDEVVASQTVSDVDVGVFQSGGIDSSLISFALGRRGSAQQKLPAFCASVPEKSHDEHDLAAQVAEAAGLECRRVLVELEANAEQDFLEVVRGVDGQLADSSAFAVLHLCRAVRREVTVALSGDGADELFGGYTTYLASQAASRMKGLRNNKWLAHAGTWLGGLGGGAEGRLPLTQVAARLVGGLSSSSPHAEWRRYLPADLCSTLYGPSLRPLLPVDPLRRYRAAQGDDDLDGFLLADQRHYLPADMLRKVDAMSMAVSLEVRVPFLDRRVMDFASTLDAALLCPTTGPPKRILRELLKRQDGPPDVVQGKKRGFQVPVARMLRTSLRDLGERLLVAEVDRVTPWLDAGGCAKIWREHQDRSRNHGYTLWTLLSLAAWLESLDSGTGTHVR